MGDWNAKVGEQDGRSRNVGRFGLGTRNERGANFVEFAQAHNLKIANTFFKKKGKRKWTWVSPDSNTRNQIDHILVNDISIIKDVTTLSKISFPSDQGKNSYSKKSEMGSSTETVAFQEYEILKIEHEFLQFF